MESNRLEGSVAKKKLKLAMKWLSLDHFANNSI
jgi:hypothetical protein